MHNWHRPHRVLRAFAATAVLGVAPAGPAVPDSTWDASSTVATTTAPPTTGPGATTSTTTESSGSSTTTTLPAGGCDDPAASALDVIICRLMALDAQVQVTPDLGNLQKMAHAALSAAVKGAQRASDACGSTNGTKKASQHLKRLNRHLAGASFRLRSLAARRKVSSSIRDPFIQEIRSIKRAVSTLRKNPCS